MASGSDFISVFARVKPSDQPSASVRLPPGGRSLDVLVARGSESVESFSYPFAEVFGPDSSQQRVFDRVARSLVTGALDGVNCTLFAYGQTGSGKTFTMCGGKANYMRDRGIIPRTLSSIFDGIDSRDDGVLYSVSMSMIEIYKEVGRDLLARVAADTNRALPPVTVSLRKGEEPVMIGAKRVALASEEDGLQQYCQGEVHRAVAETAHNQRSSRSHCVCTIFIEASDPATQTVRTSKIQIVDLAGSERLKPYEKGSQETKGLMNEAVAINLSLHHLSEVITALGKKAKVVPHRNSFLTKLLKDALGGNAKAAMVCTVDPADASLPETINSCRFAQRVANVRTAAKVNEERDPQLLIAELRRRNAELEALAAGGGAGDAGEPPVPDDELRVRIQNFLEDDGGGAAGGAALKVGPMPQGAVAAFRLFRELFWERLRAGGRAADAIPESARGSPTAELCDDAEPASQCRSGAGGGADRAALAECQAECRMLRAALAAQPPPRPTRKAPASSSRETKLQAMLIASQGECKRLKSALAALSSSSGRVPAPRPKPVAKPRRAASSEPRRAAASAADFAASGGRSSLAPSAAATLSTAARSTSSAPSHSASADHDRTSCSSFAPPRPPPPAGAVAGEAARPRSAQASASAAEAVGAGGTLLGPALAAALAEPAAPVSEDRGGSRTSDAWLRATSALTEDELAACGSRSGAYRVFLAKDPRAGDIWQVDLQRQRTTKRELMEEAKRLGEEVGGIRDAMDQVQVALDSLKGKLREAEDAASIDSLARQRADTLRGLIAAEEPRIKGILEEKSQSYHRGMGRLKEIKHELIHADHAQKELEVMVKAEFERWRTLVDQRYPLEIAAATAAVAAVGSAEGSEDGSRTGVSEPDGEGLQVDEGVALHLRGEASIAYVRGQPKFMYDVSCDLAFSGLHRCKPCSRSPPGQRCSSCVRVKGSLAVADFNWACEGDASLQVKAQVPPGPDHVKKADQRECTRLAEAKLIPAVREFLDGSVSEYKALRSSDGPKWSSQLPPAAPAAAAAPAAPAAEGPPQAAEAPGAP
ncbi:unnamed protein product [Prorocentrum cordatum]|uniref:Kinesin motor domain-containing protein n=1 Tax=Prorocentrum cordatum TaxID=2364126 RepID=A0ABN9Y733_9DINO|nr:unnamed protein product [Polarella glacialis]